MIKRTIPKIPFLVKEGKKGEVATERFFYSYIIILYLLFIIKEQILSWKAEYVVLESGRVPFKEFLQKLDKDSQIDIVSAIDEIIEWKNNNMTIPITKSRHLRNRIFEMRLRHKNIITRSLFFFVENKKIVFTHGYIKKTEKTPNSEIERAERLRNYYLLNK